MTTESNRARLASLGFVCLLPIVSACGSASRNSEVYFRPSDHSTEVQDNFVVFARRCSKCHSLARPLVAGVTNVEHWDHYVARMVRQPGSGITPRDVQPILAFLYYYTLEVRGLGDPTDHETLPTPTESEEPTTPATPTPAPTGAATTTPNAEATPAGASTAPPSDPASALPPSPFARETTEAAPSPTTENQGEVQ